MSFSIRLTRHGLRHKTSTRDSARVQIHRPAGVPELLRFWHYELEGVDDDVTLGDLLSLLRGVEDIGQLGPLFSCDVEAFLREADQPAGTPPGSIQHLEVHNVADLSGWEPGPRGHRFDKGTFIPPHRISRNFHGWGAWDMPDFAEGPAEGGIAIELTPLPELVGLPLRYNPKVSFETEQFAGSAFGTEITITFGEFVHAVIWEIGYFGSPGDRNEMRNEILGRAEDALGEWEEDEPTD